MSNRVLWLDNAHGFDTQMRVQKGSRIWQRNIDMTLSIDEAKRYLSGNQYDAMLVEPFFFLLNPSPLQVFMHETRTESGLYVIAYSSRREDALNREFGLYPREEYDEYISKDDPHSLILVGQALDELERR